MLTGPAAGREDAFRTKVSAGTVTTHAPHGEEGPGKSPSGAPHKMKSSFVVAKSAGKARRKARRKVGCRAGRACRPLLPPRPPPPHGVQSKESARFYAVIHKTRVTCELAFPPIFARPESEGQEPDLRTPTRSTWAAGGRLPVPAAPCAARGPPPAFRGTASSPGSSRPSCSKSAGVAAPRGRAGTPTPPPPATGLQTRRWDPVPLRGRPARLPT